MDLNINIETVTRPSVDRGRDAIGIYRVGPLSDRISLDLRWRQSATRRRTEWA